MTSKTNSVLETKRQSELCRSLLRSETVDLLKQLPSQWTLQTLTTLLEHTQLQLSSKNREGDDDDKGRKEKDHTEPPVRCLHVKNDNDNEDLIFPDDSSYEAKQAVIARTLFYQADFVPWATIRYQEDLTNKVLNKCLDFAKSLPYASEDRKIAIMRFFWHLTRPHNMWTLHYNPHFQLVVNAKIIEFQSSNHTDLVMKLQLELIQNLIDHACESMKVQAASHCCKRNRA
jgi:hypothetical protein